MAKALKTIPTTIKTSDFTRKIYVKSREESDFWREVGKYILKVRTLPNVMEVEAKIDGNVYTASLNLMKRGDVVNPDGSKTPSLHINSAVNNIPLSETKGYSDTELRCINAAGNNYKKYYLEPRSGGVYGRYGGIDVPKDKCRVVNTPYEKWLFWPLYYEKISKGYKDVTEITLAGNGASVAVKSGAVPARQGMDANQRLYAQLYEWAHGVVARNLASDTVTQMQVERAEALYDKLLRCRKVETFNRTLDELMVVSPRKRDWKTDKIGQYHAKSKDDFTSILDFEWNLILAMKGVCAAPKSGDASFRDFGIHVWEATSAQEKEVMDLIGYDSIKGMVKTVYRVKPEKQEKLFSDYCKKHSIKKKKKLFHGTLNGNMLSLILNGFDLKRQAAHGSLFGRAAYTAPSSHKSWNYTSCIGTTWAQGKEHTGYLLIYTCAYGNPYNPPGAGDYTQSFLLRNGYNCVHAKKGMPFGGRALKADEVMFYDKDAVCLSYVVELAV